MNVLSLFDGMSSGQIALNKANIKYDKYFASEIDKNAIYITQSNFPDTIQIGDVTKVVGKDLPPIDLLIGGSPCQGFSFAGKQLNFDDLRSKLFFEFVRLKNELNPKYFLLENVNMKQEYQDIISMYLNENPIKINSSLVSAQNRKRLYWTNIPNVTQPKNHHIVLRDICDTNENNYIFIEEEKTKNRYYKKNYLQYDINGTGHGSQDQRAYYLNGKHGCLDTGASSKAKILTDEGKVRKITRYEAEQLQNVPIGYTSMVSVSKAKNILGNGWTIDVIAHIFNNII